MNSLWSSNQERAQRVRHSLNILLYCFLLFLLLSLSNISSFSHGGGISSSFSTFKGGGSLPLSLEWTGKIIIILISSYLIYNSAGEILTTVISPSEFIKGKKYQTVFTLIALGPLCFTFLNQLLTKTGSQPALQNKFNIENATHYLCFQLYFLIGNIVALKFFHKFFLADAKEINNSHIVAKKVVSKLLRWHYLGWSSFFLLSFFLPFWILIITILVVFLNSSFAFLIGRQAGRKQISKFSIFKTYEGFLWSIILCSILFTLAIYPIWQSNIFGKGAILCNNSFVIFLAVGIALTSLMAHVGENTFGISKRLLGYKNFGRLFGVKIGGFWDRCDGLSITLFFVAITSWIVHAISTGGIGISFSPK